MPCQTAGMSCTVSPTGRKCTACGAMGQACCGTDDDGDCQAGLTCGGRNDGMGITGTCAPAAADGGV